MTSFAKKIRAAVMELDARQPLAFAGFLLPEAAMNWDLIIAAPWLSAGDFQAHRRLSDQIRGQLDEEEILELNRLIIIDSKSRSMAQEINRLTDDAGNLDPDLAEIRNSTFSGLPIKEGTILIARTPAKLRGMARQLAKAV